MGPVDALEIALRKEIEAKALYEDFSARYPEAREFFDFLMNEEEKHQRLIEEKILEIRGK